MLLEHTDWMLRIIRIIMEFQASFFFYRLRCIIHNLKECYFGYKVKGGSMTKPYH